MAAKFEKKIISPGIPIGFRKSHRISKNYLKSSESYVWISTFGGVLKNHPGALNSKNPGVDRVEYCNKWPADN